MRTWLFVRVILGIIVLLFTLYGFVIKQECDLDAIYLWCRLHPMSLFDIVGLILFYGGAFGLSGIWKRWITLSNPVNSARWNFVGFAILAAGIILIWI